MSAQHFPSYLKLSVEFRINTEGEFIESKITKRQSGIQESVSHGEIVMFR